MRLLGYLESEDVDVWIVMVEAVLDGPEGILRGHLAALDQITNLQVSRNVLLGRRYQL